MRTNEIDVDFGEAVGVRVSISVLRGMQQQFRVNVLGVVHSISAFLPLLRKSTSKIIIVKRVARGTASSPGRRTSLLLQRMA